MEKSKEVSVLYETDAKIRFSITGDGILLFDRDTGRMITSGRILIR